MVRPGKDNTAKATGPDTIVALADHGADDSNQVISIAQLDEVVGVGQNQIQLIVEQLVFQRIQRQGPQLETDPRQSLFDAREQPLIIGHDLSNWPVRKYSHIE